MGAIDWPFFFEVSLGGLLTGGLYALIGLGFVIVYKATRVVNFAIGDQMMISAYFFLTLVGAAGVPVWLGLALAVALGALLGGAIERVMIRPMLGESPISVVMVTIGLGSILVGIAQIVWTAEPQVLPIFMPSQPIFVFDLYIAPKIAYGALFAAVLIALYVAYFRFSRGGVALRATASDQAAAYSMGINVPGVFNMAWLFGSLAAALAGILVTASGGLSPRTGEIALSVLVVVILGGLDSVLGALIGGLVVGWLESVTGAYLGGEVKVLGTFMLLVMILVVRPYGLFGTHEIERL